MSSSSQGPDSETFSILAAENHDNNTKEPLQERRAINKLNWHLTTLCGGIILLSYMDRGNVGYAASEMCRDLDLSHSEYGIGTSIFYSGYILSQLGSNVMLKRFGASIWLPFILFSWGCAAALMSLVQRPAHFFMLRVLLGVTEGGTFPGVWYYLTLFYPDRHLGEPYAITVAALAFAMPVSAPIAAGLLSLDGLFGFAGWRILFFVEGLIPICYSIFLFLYLPPSPEDAPFLDAEEKRWIRSELDKRKPESVQRNLRKEIVETLTNRNFWLLTVGFGAFTGCMIMLMYWMTLIVQDMLNGSDDDEDDEDTCASSGSSTVAVILTAIPDSLAGMLCLIIARHQTSVRNRTFVSGAVYLLSAFFLLSWILTKEISFVCGFLSLTASVMLTKIPLGFIVNVTATLFDQSMRSTVVALFNSIANTGSFVLPFLVGVVVDASGYSVAMCLAGAAMILSACCVFAVKDPQLAPKQEETNGDSSESQRALL